MTKLIEKVALEAKGVIKVELPAIGAVRKDTWLEIVLRKPFGNLKGGIIGSVILVGGPGIFLETARVRKEGKGKM